MDVVFAQEVVGRINVGNVIPGVYQTTGGFGIFISNILRLVFVAAGVWAFVNVIIGGFQFISAGGDSKAVSAAWNRIWQSLLGLIIVVGSFAIITMASYIIFGKGDAILNPQLYGPGN
jgi:outer membrane phospholipase A